MTDHLKQLEDALDQLALQVYRQGEQIRVLTELFDELVKEKRKCEKTNARPAGER